MCRIIPVDMCLFHIDPEAGGRGCLFGIITDVKEIILHRA